LCALNCSQPLAQCKRDLFRQPDHSPNHLPPKSPTGRSRYAFPNDSGLDRLLADPRLGSTAKTIAIALVKHWAWSRDHCWPSDRTIASRIGRSTGHVQRCLRQLEAAGWIRRETTSDTPNGRRIWLRWRQHPKPQAASEGAQPLPAPARDQPLAPARDKPIVVVTQELKSGEGGPAPRLRPEPQEPAAKPAPVAHVTAGELAPGLVGETPVEVGPSPCEAPRPYVEPAPCPAAAVVRPGRRWPRLSLAELESATAARSDPVLMAELAKLMAPPRPPEPDARSFGTFDLIAQLPGRHDLILATARRLCVETGDEKAATLRMFEAAARSVATRSVDADLLASCLEQATSPLARDRGRLFVSVWKKALTHRRC
jgi:hypothetical protein